MASDMKEEKLRQNLKKLFPSKFVDGKQNSRLLSKTICIQQVLKNNSLIADGIRYSNNNQLKAQMELISKTRSIQPARETKQIISLKPKHSQKDGEEGYRSTEYQNLQKLKKKSKKLSHSGNSAALLKVERGINAKVQNKKKAKKSEMMDIATRNTFEHCSTKESSVKFVKNSMENSKVKKCEYENEVSGNSTDERRITDISNNIVKGTNSTMENSFISDCSQFSFDYNNVVSPLSLEIENRNTYEDQVVAMTMSSTVIHTESACKVKKILEFKSSESDTEVANENLPWLRKLHRNSAEVISVNILKRIFEDTNDFNTSDYRDNVSKLLEIEEEANIENSTENGYIDEGNMYCSDGSSKCGEENVIEITDGMAIKGFNENCDFDSNASARNGKSENDSKSIRNSSIDIVATRKESNIKICNKGDYAKNLLRKDAHKVNSLEFRSDGPATGSHNVFYNSRSSPHSLVLLKSPLYFYGTISVTLVSGAIDIYGYSPKIKEVLKVFSPRGCSTVPITPILCELSKDDTNFFEVLKDISGNFDPNDLMDIQNLFNATTDAIVLLTRNMDCEQQKRIFKQHINENIYPNIHTIAKDRAHFKTECILDCMINTTKSDGHLLQLPKEWYQLKLEENTRLLVAGGKSVGKSTLLRFLINRHLPRYSRILLIDLDIGQPELFVPQTISCSLVERPLLGPGLFSHVEPNKAYFVGNVNVVLCAHAYMFAVKKLLNYCANNPDYNSIPWVINTMGYNKGFGIEVMQLICGLLQPTHVVQFRSKKPINNFDISLDPETLFNVPLNFYNFHDLTQDIVKSDHILVEMESPIAQESRYQREWQMSALDMRYVMFLERLSSILQNEADWFNNCPVFCADLKNIHLLNLLSPQATRDETIQACQSNIVYLCSTSDDMSPECFGIAIVRGIDYHQGQIYLLPAVPYVILEKVDCLALGTVVMAKSVLTKQSPNVKGNIPYTHTIRDTASSKAIKQMYYRPKGFIRKENPGL